MNFQPSNKRGTTSPILLLQAKNDGEKTEIEKSSEELFEDDADDKQVIESEDNSIMNRHMRNK